MVFHHSNKTVSKTPSLSCFCQAVIHINRKVINTVRQGIMAHPCINLGTCLCVSVHPGRQNPCQLDSHRGLNVGNSNKGVWELRSNGEEGRGLAMSCSPLGFRYKGRRCVTGSKSREQCPSVWLSHRIWSYSNHCWRVHPMQKVVTSPLSFFLPSNLTFSVLCLGIYSRNKGVCVHRVWAQPCLLPHCLK